MQHNNKTSIRLLFSYKDKFFHPEEINMRGYLNVTVEIDFKRYYEVVFYSFEIIDSIKKNGGYSFSEPGLILIQELKGDLMYKCLKELYENSIFFEGLKEYPKNKYKNYKEANF